MVVLTEINFLEVTDIITTENDISLFANDKNYFRGFSR